jgi:hypothetical protein
MWVFVGRMMPSWCFSYVTVKEKQAPLRKRERVRSANKGWGHEGPRESNWWLVPYRSGTRRSCGTQTHLYHARCSKQDCTRSVLFQKVIRKQTLLTG